MSLIKCYVIDSRRTRGNRAKRPRDSYKLVWITRYNVNVLSPISGVSTEIITNI